MKQKPRRNARRLVIGLAVGMIIALGAPIGPLRLIGADFGRPVGKYPKPTPAHKGEVRVEPTSLSLKEGAQAGHYQVALNEQPTSDVTVLISFDSDQISVDPTFLVFTPEDFRKPQMVNVTANADGVSEGDHTTIVTHRVLSADPTFGEAPASDVTVQIKDPPPGKAKGNGKAVEPVQAPLSGSILKRDLIR